MRPKKKSNATEEEDDLKFKKAIKKMEQMDERVEEWKKNKEEDRPSKARQMLLKLKEEKQLREAKKKEDKAGNGPHPKPKESDDRGGSSGSNA